MGIFDWFKSNLVNNDIQRIEKQKEQHKKRVKELEFIKKNSVPTPPILTIDSYLSEFDKNISCEDGKNRKYRGKMYGVIKDSIDEYYIDCNNYLNASSKSTVEYKINQFKIHQGLKKPVVKKDTGLTTIEVENEKFDGTTELSIKIRTQLWFSKKGKYLSTNEILNVGEIRIKEHNEFLNNNVYVKGYQYKGSILKMNHSFSRNYKCLIISKINNIYFIKRKEGIRESNNYYDFSFYIDNNGCYIDEVGTLFNGKINNNLIKDGREV